jgi:hypothetical protein
MQITKYHLDFLQECRQVFDDEIIRTTHISVGDDLIALRYGADRDCIKILELGQEVGFFSQMIPPTGTDEFIEVAGKNYNKDMHEIRPELGWFTEQMEMQLLDNDHKGGWIRRCEEFLIAELEKNLKRIKSTSTASVEYQRKCANIANYAMMLADKDRQP